ncbi:MAG: hypothetical protein JRI62_00110 [Deltaproteobacteria bacterium]|nr:hypothetical protein [Deltaproteobacteria bacterium]MBW1833224.1 hypothetical protein [Deltaproteobacteria bacterium]
MNEQVEAALEQKKAFLKIEEHLLIKAIELYSMGYNCKNLSSSQMSAVGEHLRQSETIEKAQRAVCDFIKKRLERPKDKDKTDITEKNTSWLIQANGKPDNASLGKILIEWINKERYLENVTEFNAIWRLTVLRRFWNNVYGQYRYCKVMDEDMSLEKEKLP